MTVSALLRLSAAAWSTTCVTVISLANVGMSEASSRCSSAHCLTNWMRCGLSIRTRNSQCFIDFHADSAQIDAELLIHQRRGIDEDGNGITTTTLSRNQWRPVRETCEKALGMLG